MHFVGLEPMTVPSISLLRKCRLSWTLLAHVCVYTAYFFTEVEYIHLGFNLYFFLGILFGVFMHIDFFL